MAKKGMGFKAAASSVAQKQGIPKKQAQAIIAAGARKASPAAKKANPNLKKVAAKKVPGKAMAETDKVKVNKPAPAKGYAGGSMCAAEPVKRKAAKPTQSTRQRAQMKTSTMRSQAGGY